MTLQSDSPYVILGVSDTSLHLVKQITGSSELFKGAMRELYIFPHVSIHLALQAAGTWRGSYIRVKIHAIAREGLCLLRPVATAARFVCLFVLASLGGSSV